MMLVISYFISAKYAGRGVVQNCLSGSRYANMHLAIPKNKGTIDYYQCWYAMPGSSRIMQKGEEKHSLITAL